MHESANPAHYQTYTSSTYLVDSAATRSAKRMSKKFVFLFWSQFFNEPAGQAGRKVVEVFRARPPFFRFKDSRINVFGWEREFGFDGVRVERVKSKDPKRETRFWKKVKKKKNHQNHRTIAFSSCRRYCCCG